MEGIHPVGAAVANPKKTLEIITWNIGSLRKHRVALFGMLSSFAPHIVFVQEASLPCGLLNSIRHELRPLGYMVHCSPHMGLLTVARRGLNFAPIRSQVEDGDFRIQRFAWQIGSTRLLVRHRHAHSSSPSERARFNNLCSAECAGDICLDVGDFNELPVAEPGFARVFPDSGTFRLNSQLPKFETCIDGAVVSNALAHGATAHLYPAVDGAQHCPVGISFPLTPEFHECFRWVVPRTRGSY